MEDEDVLVQRLTVQKRSAKPCPPTPTRPKSVARSPFSRQKHKSRRMSEQLSTLHVNFRAEDVLNTNVTKIASSFSVPDLRVTPAEDLRTEEEKLHVHKSVITETPHTPLRVFSYKTNVNPFSPSRGHPTARGEFQIPTEKEAVPRYVSDFEQHSDIGRGSFSTVVLCLNRTDGWTYAIKKLLYQTEKMKEKFLQEAYALAALGQHPHIVRYYGSWEDKTINAIYIQCEWCKGGSLKKQPSSSWTQNTLCNVLRQISMALSYMHTKGFSHGDVKPENILVDSPEVEENSIYKICDLGQINDSGDGKYLAPEVLHYEDEELKMNPEIMSRADIFSLGISIFELAHEHATNKSFPIKQRSQITQEDIVLPGEVFDYEFVLLLQLMMHRDPSKRPTADQILRHPLVRDDLEWRLEQETNKVTELQKRLEELERELLKSKKQRFGPSYPKRVNKFDMSDLKINLVNGKVLCSRSSSPSIASPFPTHGKDRSKDDMTVTHSSHSQQPSVLTDITNFVPYNRVGFSPSVSQPMPTVNIQTTAPPTPVFSPGLSFSFSPPPSNP